MSTQLFSDEEIDNEYKKKLFLNALCNGKLPQRKNLFKNIMFLAGEIKHYQYCETINSTLEKYTKCGYIHLKQAGFAFKLKESSEFINRLRRYLNNKFSFERTRFTYSNSKLEVHYNKEDIKWSLIDHDLIIEHPKKTIRKENGFVYIASLK